MSRREQTTMSPDAIGELEAIDAALAGGAVPAERAPTAQLARDLRGLRPQAQADFVRRLDARAADGFGRGRAAARRGRLPFLGVRTLPLGALAGAGAGAAVLVAVVLLALSGMHGSALHSPHAMSGRAAPSLTEAGPAHGGGASALKKGAKLQSLGPAQGPLVKSGAAQAGPSRQVERTSTLDVGVAPGSVQPAAERVFALVSAYGGYVRSSNVSSGSGEGGASFDARVPTGNLASAIAALSRLGHVRSENDTTNDVTGQYGALQHSLADAQAERASALGLLARAATAERARELRGRLAGLERRIAGLQATLGSLRTRIDYTPLTLSLTPEHGAGSTAGADVLTPGGAAHDAARVLVVALAVLVIGAAAALPLALAALAGWALVTLARRRLREGALDANA